MEREIDWSAKYKCAICGAVMPAMEILDHMKEYHPLILEQFSDQNGGLNYGM